MEPGVWGMYLAEGAYSPLVRQVDGKGLSSGDWGRPDSPRDERPGPLDHRRTDTGAIAPDWLVNKGWPQLQRQRLPVAA